jgi:hypothetical protein
VNSVANKISEEQLAALRAANPRGIVKRLVGPEAAEDADCDDFIFRVPNLGDYNSYKVHQKSTPGANRAVKRTEPCSSASSPTRTSSTRLREPQRVEDLGEDLVEAAACDTLDARKALELARRRPPRTSSDGRYALGAPRSRP